MKPSISKIVILPVKPEDAMGIQSLLKEASREMYLIEGLSERDFNEKYKNSLSKEEIDKCAKNIASLSEKEKFIVALVNNKIVGGCYAEKGLSKNVLHAMYVLPEFQGQGIGIELWNNINDFFDPTKDIALNVLVNNKKAIKFYEKLGFAASAETTQERFTTKDGVVISEIEMIRKAVLP